MQEKIFYKIGHSIYKLRWLVIVLWLTVIIACIPNLPNIMQPFKSTGFVADHSESVQANDYLRVKLGLNLNRFVVVYHSDQLSFTNPSFAKKIKNSLANLSDFPIHHIIILPEDNDKQISKDKHTAYAVIIFDDTPVMTQPLLAKFRQSVMQPTHMTMYLGGEPIFTDDVSKQTQTDLFNADYFAAPFSIITLLVVFGSLVAALLPIILGGGCALVILTALYFIGQVFTLSIFTINIALLLGLCLSLDYSLFIISRFREELRQGTSAIEAVANTMATAGEAVFFSGLAVLISLSALLLFPVNILISVAVGGMLAVFSAVAIAITLLPAILAVLYTRIDFIAIKLKPKISPGGFRYWRWLATNVVRHRYVSFLSILLFLLLLGIPFLNVNFGISGFSILPPKTEIHQFFDIYSSKFDVNELTPITIVVTAENGKILSQHNLNKLHEFTNHLKQNAAVKQVNSIVTTNNKLTSQQYYQYYKQSRAHLTDNTKKLLDTTTHDNVTTISVVSKFKSGSDETNALIKTIKHMNPGQELHFQLTGSPVSNQEVLATIAHIFPFALLWIMTLTYIVLFFLLRSLFLPLKAILMNVLSLTASYGVLVFVFQEGHLAQLLNFNQQGMLDVSLIIIIFCALFGFSMDYEVFLLTRIKEAYEKDHSNNESIIIGLEQSGWIITSAALIVICICASFMVADVLMVKAFGLGIAVAVFVDAFLVRTLLVPSTMSLLEKWNWYLPKWMKKD